MRVSTLYLSAAALLAPLVVSASPVPREDAQTILVLKFADTLERLESGLYKAGLQMFKDSDFLAAGFTNAVIPTELITTIQSDEATHDTALSDTLVALGQTPLNCTFNLTPLLTNAATFVKSAQTVEVVGVGAYSGAAFLIGDPRVLTVAASILPVEARHSTVLNILQGDSPIPQAFDIPLLPNEVAGIVSPLISGCDLGIQPNTPLTITNPTIAVGTTLQFSSPALNSSSSSSGVFCQILAGGANVTTALPVDQCVVPPGSNGPLAVFLTSDSQPLNGNVVDRQVQPVLAGPAVVIVDVSDPLGQLVRNTTTNTTSY